MPQRTLREAVTQVTRNLSLVNGTNMTPYSDDLIVSYLIAAHEDIMGEAEWAEMIVWRPRVLDGVNGLITELITDTDDWKKVRRIYHESTQVPMPMLSSYTNPQTTQVGFGYRGIPPEEDNPNPPSTITGKYLVKFYPLTLTGNVMFQIERDVDFTKDETVLPIDWWLHVYTASWMYAADDGTNPAQLQKYVQLSKRRMGQVMAAENSRHSHSNPRQFIPNEWFEDDAPYN